MKTESKREQGRIRKKKQEGKKTRKTEGKIKK